MKQLHKFFSLTPDYRQLLLSTFVLLGLVRLGLWLLPFGTLQWFLTNLGQINSVSIKRQNCFVPTKETIAQAVKISSRYMLGETKCLAQALTMQVLMIQSDYSSELRIGVAKGKGGEFEAHAWVESQGEIVMGYLKDLSRYTTMSSFEGL